MSEQPTSAAEQQQLGPPDSHQAQATPALPAPRHAGEGRPETKRRRAGIYLALIAAVVAGLAAGVLLHERIGGWFGLHGHDHKADAGGKTKLWTCSMHPQVIKEEPGICPICHMKLEPLDVVQSGQSTMGGGPAAAAEESAGTAVHIDPVVVQNMGVRVAEVTKGPVRQEIRAVGYLEEAQPLVHDVNLRVSGWVEKLYADTVGTHLKKGDKLFDLYSPEVQVAVEELIAARKSLDALGPRADELARRTSKTLIDAARRKLELWGLEPAQVDQLAKLDNAPRTVTFTSPITGHVTEKRVVEGAAVKAGDMAMRIVDHSTLWLDAQVYAQDLPFIKLGQKVTATVEGVPGKTLEGEVVFIHPHVDPTTRTATVRMALPNPDLTLRPGMYATAHVLARLADDAVLVPREAVLDTGTRQVVFLSKGDGHFQPREVKLGSASGDGNVQVLAGLAPGETVVTSGQFLLDAESRMREAIQKHLNERLLADASPDRNKVPAGAPASAEMRPNASVPASTQPASVDQPGPINTVAMDPSGAPPSTTAPASTAPAAAAPAAAGPAAGVDAVAAAYLRVSQVLGAPQTANTPVELEPLAEAARQAAAQVPGDVRPLADRVVAASAAMAGQPLAEQRRLFKPLSEAVIALLDRSPPSKSVAGELYVAHCPMALDKGANWVQVGRKVANPYYATEMKQCGQIKRRIGR